MSNDTKQQDVTPPIELEVFKCTSIRRMTTGGNYVNLTADVVLHSKAQEVITKLEAERDAIATDLASAEILIEAQRNQWKCERDRAEKAEAALAEMQREREALRPFATDADIYDNQNIGDNEKSFSDNVTVGDLRRARSALTKEQQV